jgi:hypothetical protein
LVIITCATSSDVAGIDDDHIDRAIGKAEIGIAFGLGHIGGDDAQFLAFERVEIVAAIALAGDDLPAAFEKFAREAEADAARGAEDEDGLGHE